MTDGRTPSTDPDAEARIRALQERRAAASRSGSSSGRKRRGHAAEASRVVVAGLSVASFLTIGTAITVAQQQQHAASVTAGQPAVTGQAAGPSPSGSTAPTVPAAAAGAPAAPVRVPPAPVTVSRGS